MDNGSLHPAAVRALRALAGRLSERLQRPVMPVSLAHVDRIDPAELDGEPALTVEQALAQRLAAGDRDFLILPLFFGPSHALNAVLPQRLEALKADWPGLNWRLAPPVCPLPGGEPLLVDLLAEYRRLTALQAGLQAPELCLVDHGSPSPAVTAVRHWLAGELERRLAQPVAEAAMERREGAEYDFNGDTLEAWLEARAGAGAREILLLLLFFLPGRHAGPGGDIEAIIERVMARHPGLCIAASPLPGEHPLLVEILVERLRAAAPGFKLPAS